MTNPFSQSLERASRRVALWPDTRRGAFELRMGMKLPPRKEGGMENEVKANIHIDVMFFFPNGNYFAFDKKDHQIESEQGSAWLNVLQDKLRRGVIDGHTKLNMNGWGEMTVQDLVDSGKLNMGAGD